MPQARAALKKARNDVMQAAEMIFAGEFDNVAADDTDTRMEDAGPARKATRPLVRALSFPLSSLPTDEAFIDA